MKDRLLKWMTMCMMTREEKKVLRAALLLTEDSIEEEDFEIALSLQEMYIRNALIRTAVFTMAVIFGGQVMAVVVNVIVS
jgi:hypothetical protein